MEEAEAKKAFALAWLREPKDAFKAALAVFGQDTRAALNASTFWINDSEVLAEKDRLIQAAENGEDSFLPSKVEMLSDLYQLTKSTYVEGKDKVAAFKLYAEVRGWTPKAGPTVNVDNSKVVNNKVMVIQDHGSDNDWQEKLLRQQRQLISEASGSEVAH